MIKDIKLDAFPKEAGVYLFKANEEIIYVGSSKNIHMRMINHRRYIKQGSKDGHQQDLYQFLQSNPFTVEFQLTDNYKQLEQDLIEKYHPKYNAVRAYSGLGAKKGNKAEYDKEYKEKYKEEIKQYNKQWYESNKEEIKQYYDSHKEKILEQKKEYCNQLCCYEGKTLTLNALRQRLKRQGFDHPQIEAKKYLIKKETKAPIEFYDVYP